MRPSATPQGRFSEWASGARLQVCDIGANEQTRAKPLASSVPENRRGEGTGDARIKASDPDAHSLKRRHLGTR